MEQPHTCPHTYLGSLRLLQLRKRRPVLPSLPLGALQGRPRPLELAHDGAHAGLHGLLQLASRGVACDLLTLDVLTPVGGGRGEGE